MAGNGAKRKRPVWAVVAVLVLCSFAVGIIVSLARPLQPSLPAPLDAYPRKEALAMVAPHHLNATGLQGRRPLLIVSWSGDGGTGQWDELAVPEKGRAWVYRNIWNWAVQGSQCGNGPMAYDGPRLRPFLDRLGPSASPPPIDRVLIVSFHRDGRWITRLFDRTAPPQPLRQLEAIITGRDAGGFTVLWPSRPQDEAGSDHEVRRGLP